MKEQWDLTIPSWLPTKNCSIDKETNLILFWNKPPFYRLLVNSKWHKITETLFRLHTTLKRIHIETSFITIAPSLGLNIFSCPIPALCDFLFLKFGTLGCYRNILRNVFTISVFLEIPTFVKKFNLNKCLLVWRVWVCYSAPKGPKAI